MVIIFSSASTAPEAVGVSCMIGADGADGADINFLGLGSHK